MEIRNRRLDRTTGRDNPPLRPRALMSTVRSPRWAPQGPRRRCCSTARWGCSPDPMPWLPGLELPGSRSRLLVHVAGMRGHCRRLPVRRDQQRDPAAAPLLPGVPGLGVPALTLPQAVSAALVLQVATFGLALYRYSTRRMVRWQAWDRDGLGNPRGGAGPGAWGALPGADPGSTGPGLPRLALCSDCSGIRRPCASLR
jgi:hypothetical protein